MTNKELFLKLVTTIKSKTMEKIDHKIKNRDKIRLEQELKLQSLEELSEIINKINQAKKEGKKV